jgi:hypothetical protein
MRSRLFSIPSLLVLIIVGVFAIQPFAPPRTAQATSPLAIDSSWCDQVESYPDGTPKVVCYASTSGGTGSHTHTWSLTQGGTPIETVNETYYSEIWRPCSRYNITTFWFKVQDSSGSQITIPRYVDCRIYPFSEM